ncbi:hypothetical protein AAEX37_01732 [Oligella sp. MSHR50489EDL]|uniref:hypothetical protein n=1 Tax=Oligella sp. MSHR50489EDL TaxID=3139409 RepID=UPI003D816808
MDYQTIREANLADLSYAANTLSKVETLTADVRLWFKALQKNQFFYFDNLKRYFPSLKSTKEFLVSEDYLGSMLINVKAPQSLDINSIAAREKLAIIEKVLIRIADSLRRNYKKHKGTYSFQSKPLKEVFTDYSVYVDELMIVNQRITSEDSTGKPWYVYDKAILNQLEHRFVRLLEQMMANLRNKYDEIYLLRNDEKTTRFKLTEFDGVRGFMPDFIMLLKEKGGYHQAYQVFLEPKGADRVLTDEWKQNMLEAICDENLITIEEDDNVRLIGIKFFAESSATYTRDGIDFVKDFESKLYEGKKLLPATIFEI